ncbi:hypothetical protein BRADI_2g18431v3 [Brachypodium distachyon]|uniref:Peptidase S9 prolyl oligopeptidase catalytic domain-containing protein n=1 Tax=Brachypodium distachyon TaxID=15368 RepID=A0A2K2D937_BRADI|nr:hypothetical protein BRADI_2g18431v3 [Brachypodium distachyon]
MLGSPLEAHYRTGSPPAHRLDSGARLRPLKINGAGLRPCVPLACRPCPVDADGEIAQVPRESEGEFQCGNYQKEAEDLRSVVSYLSEQKYDIIALVGHSKGGNAVLLYASMYPDVPAIVNISGRFALEHGEFEYRVTEESLRDRLSTDTLLSSRSISKNCRVLTVHGSKDETVPARDALMFAANIPNHELHIVAGANHWYTGHEQELTSLVLDFIRPRPRAPPSLHPKL